MDAGTSRRDAAFEPRGMGEVDGSVRRILVPWRQGPRRSRSVRIDSMSTTPNASISGHPASPCCDGTSTPHRAQIRIASNISASFPNRGSRRQPSPAVPLACRERAYVDPGRLLAQVGSESQMGHSVSAVFMLEVSMGPIVRASTLRLGERPSRSSVPGDGALAVAFAPSPSG